MSLWSYFSFRFWVVWEAQTLDLAALVFFRFMTSSSFEWPGLSLVEIHSNPSRWSNEMSAVNLSFISVISRWSKNFASDCYRTKISLTFDSVSFLDFLLQGSLTCHTSKSRASKHVRAFVGRARDSITRSSSLQGLPKAWLDWDQKLRFLD